MKLRRLPRSVLSMTFTLLCVVALKALAIEQHQVAASAVGDSVRIMVNDATSCGAHQRCEMACVAPETIIVIHQTTAENANSKEPWGNLLPVVIGGLLAIAGGVAGAVVRAHYAQHTRLQEEIAARKIVTCQEAYAKIKQLESLHGQAHDGHAFKSLMGYEGWFWEHRLYLPGEFAQLWIELKATLRTLLRRQNYGEKEDNEIEVLEAHATELIEKAIQEVYKVTKNKPLVAKPIVTRRK